MSDIEKSTRFYKEVIDLPIKTRSVPDWVEFLTKDTTLALHPAKNKSRIRPGGVLVGFMVNISESTANILKDRDVKFFKELKNESFGKHAIIEDPDGYLISIAEIKSKPSEESTFWDYWVRIEQKMK